MKSGYIYKITNNLSDKIYVGQTSLSLSKRLKKHIASSNEKKNQNIVLYRAFKKYGIANFVISEIEEVSLENLSEREQYWISKLDTVVPNGYNILSGGNSMFGTNNPFYGKIHSEETKQKFSNIASFRIGELNHFYGKTHSQETKQKISLKNTGRVFGEEKRKAVTKRMETNNPFKGKHHTQETKLFLSDRRKTKNINMVSDDANVTQFSSFDDLIIFLKQNKIVSEEVKEKSIRKRIVTGIKHNKKVYGYHWSKYA
jgi:group I intron endonuclease